MPLEATKFSLSGVGAGTYHCYDVTFSSESWLHAGCGRVMSPPLCVSRRAAVSWYTMNRSSTQHSLLKSAKDALGLDWDTLAVTAGIAPRALKSYRLPSSSRGYREMPVLARAAIEELLSQARVAPTFDQHAYLQGVMAQLGLTRTQLATALGLPPETLRNYLRPPSTEGHRPLPALVRSATQRLLRSRQGKKDAQKGG